MEIYPIGTEVFFKDCDIKGRISQISIFESNKTTYQVTYWKDNFRYDVFVNDFEISAEKVKKERLGFRV